MTSLPRSENIHTEDRLERRDRLAVFVVFVLSVLIVWRANVAISREMRGASAIGQVVLLLVLPLIAILTRPVSRWRNAQHRQTNGLVWAIRERSVRFVIRSLLRWLAVIVFVGISTIVLANVNVALMVGVCYVVMLTSLGIAAWNLFPKHEYFTSGLKTIELAGDADEIRNFVTSAVTAQGRTRVFAVQGVSDFLQGREATPVVEVSRPTWLSPLLGTSKRRVEMFVSASGPLPHHVDGVVVLAGSGIASKVLETLALRGRAKRPKLSIAVCGNCSGDPPLPQKQRVRLFNRDEPPAEVLAWTVKA